MSLDRLDALELDCARNSTAWTAELVADEPVGEVSQTILEVRPDKLGRFPIQEGKMYFVVNSTGDFSVDMFLNRTDAERAIEDGHSY